jgi:hypothetical protein
MGIGGSTGIETAVPQREHGPDLGFVMAVGRRDHEARSVGLTPVASPPKGALVIQPSAVTLGPILGLHTFQR